VKLALTPGLSTAFPGIGRLIYSVWSTARYLDCDIPFEGVYVQGRRGNPGVVQGWAQPITATHDERWGRDDFITHPHGTVELIIGRTIAWGEVVRLCAHEFRHLGQFQRGYRHYGHMTVDPLTVAESEDDAYWFEDRVLGEFCSLTTNFATVNSDA
jgi:hypothetical protein